MSKTIENAKGLWPKCRHSRQCRKCQEWQFGSNFGNGKGDFCANSADGAVTLAIGLPPPRLQTFLFAAADGRLAAATFAAK